MSLTLYLLYRDEDISQFNHPHITPLKVEKASKYYESEIFNQIDIDNLPQTEKIGFITPSVFRKYGKRDLDLFVTQLQNLPNNRIVPIAYNPNPCPSEAVYAHGQTFVDLWSWIIESLGYSSTTNDKFHVICCNMWIAPRDAFIDYVLLARKAMKNIDNAPQEIKDKFFSDSNYFKWGGKLTPKECMEKFGVPHYPYHPFLLERLISFFKYIYENKLIQK